MLQGIEDILMNLGVLNACFWSYLKSKEKTGDEAAKAALGLMRNLSKKTFSEVLDFLEKYS